MPFRRTFADPAKVAQLVEHDLAKVGVAGSNPVFRSFSGAGMPRNKSPVCNWSICDSSSVGRAPSFQVGGGRFEPCLLLNPLRVVGFLVTRSCTNSVTKLSTGRIVSNGVECILGKDVVRVRSPL